VIEFKKTSIFERKKLQRNFRQLQKNLQAMAVWVLKTQDRPGGATPERPRWCYGCPFKIAMISKSRLSTLRMRPQKSGSRGIGSIEFLLSFVLHAEAGTIRPPLRGRFVCFRPYRPSTCLQKGGRLVNTIFPGQDFLNSSNDFACPRFDFSRFYLVHFVSLQEFVSNFKCFQ
jgi:hypothetical protein